MAVQSDNAEPLTHIRRGRHFV